MPRPDWLTAECAAQAELAEVSPVPAPRPVALGRPGIGYPMPFAIQTWVPGSVPRIGQYADSDFYKITFIANASTDVSACTC